MDLGQNIKRYRLSNKMEQKDLAALLNVSNRTVSSWECGRTEPKIGMIEKMCRIFHCEKTDLIGSGPINDDFYTNEEMRHLCAAFRCLDAEKKTALLTYATFLLEKEV